MNIGEVVSKAIKEGKWLNISYINKKFEKSSQLYTDLGSRSWS